MRSLREAWIRTVAFFRKSALDRDLDEELVAHVDLATDEQVRRGVPEPEARRLALARLGGLEAARLRHREARGLPSLDGLLQDVRYAVRSLRRSPGFTTIAIVTLAIGIGVNTAVFTLTNAVLFKGFPLVRGGDRVLYIASQGDGYGPFVSYADFEDWRAQAQSFKGMGAVNAVRMSLSDQRGFPQSYNGTQVTANTFAVLGLRPMLGRDFVASDEMPGAAPVAILSYDLWERRYGRDSAIIGQTLRINGGPTTVIGVMPEGFSFPRAQDLWVPLVPTADLERREARLLWFAFGRLTASATTETARAEMAAIGGELSRAYPRTNAGLAPAVQTFQEFFVGTRATTLYWSMLGAVGFVLLIACANLANLLVGRTIGRSREMALRRALGAGRWRVVRQLLIESVLLSTLGGILGWLIATWALRAHELAAGPPGWFDRVLDYTTDYRVVAYLFVMSIGTGLLFGAAPISRLSTLAVNATLKDGGRGVTAGRRRRHLSSLLVIGEMALAVVLLAGAGVMIRSVLNIYAADLGIRTGHILTAFVDLPEATYPDAEAQRAFYGTLSARLGAVPGVESITVADRLPTQGARRVPYELADAPPVDAHRPPILSALTIGPAYFRTLGAAVLAGRELNDFDSGSGIPVAIVSEQFASRHWPGDVPLGKRLRLLDGTTPDAWLTIVGVVANIVQGDITPQRVDPLIYVPYRQQPTAGMWVFARTRVPPETLAPAFRSELQVLDADLPMFGVSALDERLADGYRSNELSGGLFLTFAAIALLLASIGLYAVIAHSVSQRTQEIGVRTAMGATPRDILALVIGQGMRPVGIGLTVGLAAALAVTPVLRSQLVQVSPADPVTFIVAPAVLIIAAMLGCWIPARRAMRVDPVVALRHE